MLSTQLLSTLGQTASVESRISCRMNMDLLEYRLLRKGEEEAALDFFYSNFVAKEGQLSSVGAGRNEEVTIDMQTMLKTGALCLVGILPDSVVFQGQRWWQLMLRVKWLVN